MAKSDETYAEKEPERIDAVNRYQRGERPFKICKSLGRSSVWLRKWIKRYNVIEFMPDCRIKNAIPNYLQMDNGASFIGDLIHSRHFSRVVRLCHHPGVEPVFIAPGKPWMSGTIEDFNVDFVEKLWK